MQASVAIPIDERAPQLKDFLFDQAMIVGKIRSERKVAIPESATPFLFLVFPWIVNPTSDDQQKAFEARRQEFIAAGFDGRASGGQLGNILDADKHLRECCVAKPQLAHCCDLGFINAASSLIAAGAPKEKLNEVYDRFVADIYGQGRFRAIALCHIFNLGADQPSLKFGDVRVERLDASTISQVLGETSAISFIHPPGTGDYFVISELEGPCDDHVAWLFGEKNKAELFLHVLQYFKNGVVHMDCAAPYFLPHWVNQIRKWGIFFVGNPRRFPYEKGQKTYTISKEEIAPIQRWWSVYQRPEILKRIDDLSNKLRQAGLRAGEYYELNHTQEKPTDRLLSLAVALEALFSPDDKGEFTFRIAQSLGQLVGTAGAQRSAIFVDTKKFYSRRSELIHGQYDLKAYLEGRFVTHDECDRWASYIRQAILRFLVLCLRGRNDRSEILSLLSTSALDAETGEKLRRESELSTFLDEIANPV
jgi:hypothetical protein